MVSYVLGDGNDTLFDPAVGAGAFFRAAKRVGRGLGLRPVLLGTELDPNALQQALDAELSPSDLAGVRIADFLLDPPGRRFKGIVANPPYIRHHRLSPHLKSQLRRLGSEIIGRPLDGRAGIHVYFLLRALQLLAEGGRLAFIMPADTCEGVFAPALWSWITVKYRLESVITFDPGASPFPRVDTNPVVFLIRHAVPVRYVQWARCLVAGGSELTRWVQSGFALPPNEAVVAVNRSLAEGLATGLSRSPQEKAVVGVTLFEYARVIRGIATGANEFFFLTAQQARDLQIPDEFLVPAVGRTRDIEGLEINSDTLRNLSSAGRPTLLFSPDGRPIDQFPEPVRAYLKYGERIGMDKKVLLAMRKPWYKMEVRAIPPILFAYLGRRNVRFVRNVAGIVPLTGFLCIYPRSTDPEYVEKLWRVLSDPETVNNLSLVGKSYGDGAVKVEPRALERLPIPVQVLQQVNLPSPARSRQLPLMVEGEVV
jgi:hypothetical protein